MPKQDDLKNFRLGGLNTDDSPEFVAPNDYLGAVNTRNTGTAGQDAGKNTNIESNTLLAGMLLAGFNDCVGGGAFEDTRQAAIFRNNTAGKNQILLYDYDTNTYTPIYTDQTDSGGATLLPITPNNWIQCVLINSTYLIWVDAGLEVGYTNLQKLASGAYGVVLDEDLSLLKPQCMIPPIGAYGSDAGRPSNDLFGKLPQAIVQYVNDEFNYSAWSTRSKRLVPYQQNTPVAGSDVSQNNYIVWSFDIGSIRATTLNFAVQFQDEGIFSQVKTVARDYVAALPNTAVNVDTEVYEAYDPATNLYSFAFYNDTVAIPIAGTETDLLYDYIWPSNAVTVINGNIAGLGDLSVGYDRPSTSVTIGSVGYNPNIDIPAGTYPDPLTATGSFPGASGSGAGDHKRVMDLYINGTPHTGDKIVIVTADIRAATSTHNYTYEVPSAQDGNLLAVVTSLSEFLPNAHFVNTGGSLGYRITFIDSPYYGLQQYAIQLFFAGASVANSIPTELDNSTYQLALAYFDKPSKGRPFPLDTDNTFIIKTASYAQVFGQATKLTWNINTPSAPDKAFSYQWLTTQPPVTKLLDTLATPLVYKGSWDAKANMTTPVSGGGGALQATVGTVGDVWEITTPCEPIDTAHYTNLGNGETYNTGSYITFNGTGYSVILKSFGDLTPTGNIIAFSLTPLQILNAQYATMGINTVLVYDFANGDRCTLHWYLANAVDTFTITGGSGYTNGIYTNLPFTGGSGTGFVASVQVAGGVVTAVVPLPPGTGYQVGDVLTATVPGGSGFHITVTAVDETKVFLNDPCVNLSVFGYDAGNYIVKTEKSATFNASVLNGTNVFLRLYSPQPVVTDIKGTVWYEIGERFTITNGVHDTLSGEITDGGAYYKTRQFPDALKPYTNPPIQTLATDLNYSDFYPSAYWSKGRPRSYYDQLEKTERKASIVASQNYINGSRVNGLNRVYPESLYGDGNGQCSSSNGAIQVMWQRGDVLVVIQELNVFYIPVNYAWLILNDQITGTAISEKLLNNGRNSTKGIGIGKLKESFWQYKGAGGFISPFLSEPVMLLVDDVEPISGKNTKYFKTLISTAYGLRKRMMQYYDTFYKEVALCIQSSSDMIIAFPFDSPEWNPKDPYIIAPGAFTSVGNGAHSTVVYDPTAGTATYTPAANYVGNDVATFSFNPGGGVITKNNCLNWTAGDTSVNPFSFAEQDGVPLSTVIQSNTISVGGINIAVPISITGGQYSINGGSFTSSAGTVVNGDVVQVEVTSSATNATTTSCTLTISGTTGAFTVKTAGLGNFHADAQYGVNIVSITGGGVPAGFTSCNLMSPNSLALTYTSFPAGDIQVQLSGTPVMPAQVVLYVAGVDVAHLNVTGVLNYVLHNPTTVSDPTIVRVSINLQ